MAAPSFSSFPPSFSSFPDDEPGPSILPHSESKRSDKKHRKDRDERHGREKKDKKHRREAHIAERTIDEEATRYWYSDKRGDQRNIQFGVLHAGDVPKYKTINRGKQVLGLPLLRVISRTAHSVELGSTRRRHGPTLTDSKSRAILLNPPTRRVIAKPTATIDEDSEFLSLGRRSERNQPYRSIERDVDSDSSSSTSQSDNDTSDDEPEITLTAHQGAIKAAEEQISRNPSCTSNWLLRITLALSIIPFSSKNAVKLRAEAIIAVVERAFTVDPRNRLSVPLSLKYLRARQDLFPVDDLRKDWETAYSIGDIQIWMEWLGWRIKTDGVDSIQEAAERVLASLGDNDIAKIRVLWRVAVAFQEAGFVERAHALFQAQAELTFEIPHSLSGAPPDLQLDELEEFWDADVPRIGEADAKGWKNWVSSGQPDADPGVASPPLLPTCPDRHTQWARQESLMDRTQFLSSKSADESLDPYSTVLFSDIRPFLVCIKTDEAKTAFRLSWLSFAGLHIPGFVESWDDRWCFNHVHLDSLFPPRAAQVALTTDAVSGVIVGRERQFAQGPVAVKSWGYGVFDAMDTSTNNKEGLWGKADVVGLDHEYLRRIFRQLRAVAGWEWDALALAFEAALSVKSALKMSRAFLSVTRDSLPIWAAHARLERRRDKFADARKIYTTVLQSPPPPSQAWAARLWWDWAEMEWLVKDSEASMSVILESVGVQGASGVALLRAKRSLEERRREGGWKDQEAWVKLRALLELFTSGAIVSAIEILDAKYADGIAAESLTVSTLLFLYQHSSILKNHTPPSILRERASNALQMYPSNSIILELFLEGEKGQGVWGRVRESLGEREGVEKDVARRLQQVWMGNWQLGRWDAEVDRIRTGLRAAVQSERTMGSVILWRVYIELETRTGNLGRAKELLFRAIQECPTAKELYLLAFDQLRSQFSNEQLRAFVNTMAERGLRMRQDLDVEGDADVEMKDEDEDDGAGELEIEEKAQELRRLMPY